jgi:hypothetical protein
VLWIQIAVVHLVQVPVEHGVLKGHAAAAAIGAGTAAGRRPGDFYAGKNQLIRRQKNALTTATVEHGVLKGHVAAAAAIGAGTTAGRRRPRDFYAGEKNNKLGARLMH